MSPTTTAAICLLCVRTHAAGLIRARRAPTCASCPATLSPALLSALTHASGRNLRPRTMLEKVAKLLEAMNSEEASQALEGEVAKNLGVLLHEWLERHRRRGLQGGNHASLLLDRGLQFPHLLVAESDLFLQLLIQNQKNYQR